MSLSDYSTRLVGSLGRYGRDIDDFKDNLFQDKMASIEKMFSPEITSTAQALTNMSNIKNTVDNALEGSASGLEAIGSAVGVKKLYGAIKEKLGGKSLGDKKEVNEIDEENTGETNTENSLVNQRDPFDISDEPGIPDWLKPAFNSENEGVTNKLNDLFGNVKSTFDDIKTNVSDKMNELQGQVTDKINEAQENIAGGGADKEIEMTDISDRDPFDISKEGFPDWMKPALNNENTYDYDVIKTPYRVNASDTTGNLLKPTGATRNVPEGMTQENPTQTTTSENVSGDIDDVANGLKDTEDALNTAEVGADVAETASGISDIASNFLDAIPVIGAVLGIGLQVGTSIYSGIEEGQEQSLEAKESQEESQEKSAEEQARDAIKTNTSFTGSTVIPTFSSLSNMGGGQGIF